MSDTIRFRVTKTASGDYTATSRDTPLYRASSEKEIWQRIRKEHGSESTHHRRKGIWVVHTKGDKA